ncbi:MAG: Spy/CpxP family protein refolding chaperone [Burkholderiales bacterium]
MSKLVTTTLVSLALAAAAPLATAQATAPDASQKSQAQRPDQGKREFRLPSERVEARLAQAKTALKITAEQETQWNAFADVSRRHAKAADENVKAMRDGKRSQERLTAVERLERRQQMAATHAQRLTEVIAAAKPLYAALSAEQKAIADDLLTPRRGHSGRGHHGQRPA